LKQDRVAQMQARW